MHIQEYLSTLSIWSILLPLFTGFLYFRRLGNDSRIILGIVALATIPQLLRAFMMKGSALNISYNLYTICEVVLFYCLFVNKLFSYSRKRVFVFSGLLALLCNVCMILVYGLMERFISELVCLNNFIYTVWMLLIILDQYATDDWEINPSMPFFWYLLGLLLYAPCTMLIYSLWPYIKRYPDSILSQLWVIQYIFNIIMYVLFAAGFLHERNPKITANG